MSNVVYASDQSFETEVLRCDTSVLVDFYAPWCGPSRGLSKVLEQIAAEYAGKLKVVRVDVEEAQRTASRYALTSLPTLVVFKQGREVLRHLGASKKSTLLAELLPAAI